VLTARKAPFPDALNLERSFERRSREHLAPQSDPGFEKMADHPAVLAVMTRIDERNRADLARLLNLERELGDFAAKQ